MTTYGWARHVHHNVLWEVLTEPLATRVKYIKRHKPPWEIPTRLRLLQPMQAPPPHVIELERVCDTARRAYEAAREASSVPKQLTVDQVVKEYLDASEAYDAASRACVEWAKSDEAIALHATECPDCPWNGTTIFP